MEELMVGEEQVSPISAPGEGFVADFGSMDPINDIGTEQEAGLFDSTFGGANPRHGSQVSLFLSAATILSGDLTDCLDPTDFEDKTCRGGFASVSAVIRAATRDGDGPALFVPHLDRATKLVLIHPSGWGVNTLVARDRFGWNSYLARPSLFTTTGRDFTPLMSHDFVPVLTNVNVPVTNGWSEFLSHVHFDAGTGIALLFLVDETQPLTTSFVDSLISMLDYLSRLNDEMGCLPDGDASTNRARRSPSVDGRYSRCWTPVVVFRERSKAHFQSCLDAAVSHSHPPVIFYDVSANFFDEYSEPKKVGERTWVISKEEGPDSLQHFCIIFDGADGMNTSTTRHPVNVTLVNHDIEDLSLDFRDDVYIEDQRYLRSLADYTLENDPVVGSSGFMPLTREGVWRMCMGGECPIGNLFTDAIRWAGKADIAFASSGGLRGPGWPAGPVHVSNLWEALPFMNFLCTGFMSGVSVYRLLNYSTAVATYQSTSTPTGDRLLQVSGLRMTYNTLVDGSGAGRLMSVDIWDEARQELVPLERLKLYKFATSSWMCSQFDQYPSLLGKDFIIEGESPGLIDDSYNIQAIVGEYLVQLGEPYNTSIQHRHVNDTNAFSPMNFLQNKESCLLDFYWEESIQTCKPCPGGKYIQFSDDFISLSISTDSAPSSGRNLLSNRELVNVTVAPKFIPSWLILHNSTKLASGSTVFYPGESAAIEFDINITSLAKGSTTRSTVTFGVVLDGTYPGCLTDLDIAFDVLVQVSPEENPNHITSMRPVGLTLMGISLLLAICFSIWTFVYRRGTLVRKSQPMFLQLICFGCFVMASAILPLSIDDSIASQRGCSVACMSIPWLFSVGFAVNFSALFSKIWRLHRVMKSSERMRRVVVKEEDVMMPFIAVFSLNFIFLLCWTLIDPLKWVRQPIREGDASNTYGFCRSDGKASTIFISLLILTDLGSLVLAVAGAYITRHFDQELTESRWIGVACASWIQLGIVGVPVMILTHNQPKASYFTKTALIFLVSTSMLLLMFVPKIRLMHKKTRNDCGDGRQSIYISRVTGRTTRSTL